MEKCVVEVKYDPAFSLWDRSGLIWQHALRKWPNLQNTAASPAETVFTLDRKFELKVELGQAHVIGVQPDRSLTSFAELTSEFMGLVSRSLEIQNYSRVGFRLIYFKEYPGKAEASEAMLSAGLLNIPPAPNFGVNGAPLFPEFTCRWEATGEGVTVRLKTEGKTFDFSPPIGTTELEPMHKDYFGVSFDIDYYTIGIVSISQLNITEWIPQLLHRVRRGSEVFFRR
jgi:hypothetical protein